MKKAFASFFQNIIIIVYNNTDMSMSSMEDQKYKYKSSSPSRRIHFLAFSLFKMVKYITIDKFAF
ncbi:hypothetical protein BTA31_01025 [Bacillus haynesii]|uniref:Uncharacterized protein n=1 Tax=Bacillus haynesii TaxID=1925021 RepID=A0ABX3I920_9BACI|nr:hypothetical protein BTA31_01025 [Bacillus haynesii]